MNFNDLYIDKSWSLFLDRDGLINKRIVNGYVTRWEEFEFLPGTKESLGVLKDIFGRIIVVTNQQGIGKGIMTSADLELIHRKMLEEIGSSGGRVDKVYFSPHLASDNHPSRKPGTGMAEMALRDFPEIVFGKSIMVGDSVSDVIFGNKSGMITVFATDEKEVPDRVIADFVCSGLPDFTSKVKQSLRDKISS